MPRKKRMGRPPKNPEEIKSKRIATYVTEELYDAIEEHSYDSDMSIAEVVRKLIEKEFLVDED